MKRVAMQLIKEVAWAPLLVFVVHEILGSAFGHEPYVDPAMHFLGGAAMAYFLRRAAELSPRLVGAPSATGFDMLAFGMTCFIALLWEFGELASDIFLDTHIQRSAPNTLRDLGLGLGGAFLLLLIRSRFRRATPPS